MSRSNEDGRSVLYLYNALRQLSGHSGNLSTRLSDVLTQGGPPGLLSIDGIRDDQSAPDEVRQWVAALIDARSEASGDWQSYCRSLRVEQRQQLAIQFVGVALASFGLGIRPGLPPRVETAEPASPAVPTAYPYPKPVWFGYQSYSSSNLGLRPLTEKHLLKGRRLMRSLQQKTRSFYDSSALLEANADVDTRISSELQMIELYPCLMLVKALDEHFSDAGRYLSKKFGVGPNRQLVPYEKYRNSKHEGQVVTGLTMIRNVESHQPDVNIQFEYTDVFSAFFDDGSRGFMSFGLWPEYSALPGAVTKGRKTDKKRLHEMYEATVGGTGVLDSLMDACKFFLDCDPRIGRYCNSEERTSVDLEAFPLPSGHVPIRTHPYSS